MKTITYKLIELFIFFILIPVSFTFSFSIWIKLAIGFIGFCYIIFVLLKVEKEKFKIQPDINWKLFWKHTILKFIMISILTTVFVWITNREILFNVMIQKPKLWMVFIFIYSFFSVYPQELMYRTFFFNRYYNLISGKNLFVFFNAIVFSLGHIFFKNTLVLIITFLGGILFAITYVKTKSTFLVSIEHAIYGSWLFTVGLGAMLGFPA